MERKVLSYGLTAITVVSGFATVYQAVLGHGPQALGLGVFAIITAAWAFWTA